MEGIKFLGLLALTWLIVTGAAPVQFFKKLLKVHNESTPKNMWFQIIQKLVNCSLCTGFWVGFLYYFFTPYNPILMGCLVSYASYLFELFDKNIIGKYFNKL